MAEQQIQEVPQVRSMSGFMQGFRVVIASALVILAAIGGVYLWKDVDLNRAERQIAVQKEQFAAQKAELLRKSAELYAQDKKDALSLFSIPLAWVVRREMISENLDQIDQYFTELVKIKGFSRIVLAKADGVVALSSDRKFLGAKFDSIYPAEHLTAEQTQILGSPPGQYLLVVPIMGLNKRLGTLVISYTAETFPMAG